MTLDEIETALGMQLAGTSGITAIAWPNADFTPNGTYVEFRHSPGERFDDTLSGGYPIQDGLALMTVVTPSGGFSGDANAQAQNIADRFPKALRLAAGTGNIVINKAASFGSPFQDGAYWRQPVIASYLTEGDATTFAPPSQFGGCATGWAAYVHTGAAQAIAADTETALVNDAGAKLEGQQPIDVASLYDGAVVTGRNGDSIMVGVEFTFTPDDGTASMLRLSIDIGGGIGKLYPEEFPITSGAAVEHKVSYHPPAYTLDTWEANGGTLKVETDGPGVITGVRYVIHRLHKAR